MSDFTQLRRDEPNSDSDVGVPETKSDTKARAERLRQAIRAAGGNTAIAHRSGVPKSTIDGYLQGGEMKVGNAIALAGATGVRLDWLVTGEGPMREEEAAEAPGDLQERGGGYLPVPGPPDEWDVASLTAALDEVESHLEPATPALARIGLALGHARLFRKAHRMPQLREFLPELLAACLAAAEQVLPAAKPDASTADRVTMALSIYMLARGAKG